MIFNEIAGYFSRIKENYQKKWHNFKKSVKKRDIVLLDSQDKRTIITFTSNVIFYGFVLNYISWSFLKQPLTLSTIFAYGLAYHFLIEKVITNLRRLWFR